MSGWLAGARRWLPLDLALPAHHRPVEPLVQRMDAGTCLEPLAPCVVQPRDPAMQVHRFMDQLACSGFEQCEIFVRRMTVRREATMSAQAFLTQLARKMRPLVEQPGQNVHHPCGGLEPFGRKREP